MAVDLTKPQETLTHDEDVELHMFLFKMSKGQAEFIVGMEEGTIPPTGDLILETPTTEAIPAP